MKTKNQLVVKCLVPTSIAIASALLLSQSAFAYEGEVGDFKVNFNNAVKYSSAWRMKGQSDALVNDHVNAQTAANPGNYNDGDSNFNKGLISSRLEILSEVDAVNKDGTGVRVSAIGWNDSKYTDSSKFNSDTRKYHGRNVELRDAFVFGKSNISDMPMTFRFGQHGLVWGESLFFANNAIAGGQSAFDVTRFMADPTAQAKEFVLPVPQISGQLQVSPSFSLGAYYQFKYEGNRLPGVGSYFSSVDVVGPGAGPMVVGVDSNYQPILAQRSADMKARNSGQFGLQAKWTNDETDYGLYAIRFHDKNPQLVTQLAFNGSAVLPQSYYLANQENVTALGASMNHSFGDVNFGLEVSVRNNQVLASAGGAADTSALPVFMHPGAATNNTDNPGYAVGRTGHINANVIWALQPSMLWREATFVGEIAWNRMLSCTKNCAVWDGQSGTRDPNATRDAWSLRAVFEPLYRQVSPGVDISIPMGIGYTPSSSRSSLGPSGFPASGGGDYTIGVNAIYEHALRVTLAYTKFKGDAVPFQYTNQGNNFSYGQTLADRDFVSLTMRYSF